MPRVPTGESVLARAVRIVEAFTPTQRQLTVTQISHRSGLHVATTSRLVAELVGHGLLARLPDGRLEIGVRLWELGQRASPTRCARPPCRCCRTSTTWSATTSSSACSTAARCCSWSACPHRARS